MLSLGYVEHALNYRFVRDGELSRWTLEYLFAGHVAVHTPQGTHCYKMNSVMLIPPHTSYSVEWAGEAGDWKELYVIFDPLPQWSTLLSWPVSHCGLGILNLPNHTVTKEVESALKAGLEIQKSPRVNCHPLLFNTFERVLLTLDELNPMRGYTQRDERIEHALAYIAAHYAEPLDLAILAREVYLSPSRFSHLFRAQMQQAPIQYLEQYRLERAAEKLLTGHDSIEQLALSVGFSNVFHFSTRFRRRFGQSPSRYRRNPK